MTHASVPATSVVVFHVKKNISSGVRSMFQRGLFALRKMKKSRMRTYACQCDSPDASRSENHSNHPCPSRPFSSFTLLLSPLPDRIFEDTRNEETRRHLVLYIDEASRVRCSGKLGDGSVSNASFSRIFFSKKRFWNCPTTCLLYA